MMTTSLPLFTLILLTPLIAIALLISFMSKRKKTALNSFQSRYVMLTYCGILVLIWAVVSALPEKEFILTAEAQEQNISQAHELAANLLDIAKQGKLDHTLGINKKSDLIFEVKGNKIVLIPRTDSDYPQFVIARKESDDGIIRMASYMTPFLVQGIDITEKIQPTVVKLNGDRLEISPPVRYTLSYKSFKPDFTAEQFIGSLPKSMINFSQHMTFGIEIIYLQIPKSLEVDPNNLNVIYVKDIQ